MPATASSPHRRIDRHRHGSGVENAEECGEEIETRGQHQSYTVARLDIAADQAGRNDASRLRQFCVGHCPQRRCVILQDRQVQAIRMLRHVPVEDLYERLGLCGSRNGRKGSGRLRRAGPAWSGAGVFESIDQIADRVRLANDLSGQPHPERPLDPQNQLRPTQAVDAEIPFDPA